MPESKFQSFSDVGGPANGAARVSELRQQLESVKVTGFVVPRADEHQNEYVPPSAERLLWLTGFAGSAGTAIVLRDRAALFVDGRYVEQAGRQVDPSVFELRHISNDPPAKWIAANLRAGDKLAYDPRLHTPDGVKNLASACAEAGAQLMPLDHNPIDRIWRDRPLPPLGPVVPHSARFAGESAKHKIARVQEALHSVDGLLITDPHNFAWLFNVRGNDVPHTPIALGFAYVPREGRPRLFLDGRKLTSAALSALTDTVTLAEPDALTGFLKGAGEAGSRVLFDGATASAFLSHLLEESGGRAVVETDPITRLKAVKNKTELNGARAAHLRDGAALTAFLAWFDERAPRGGLTEIDAAITLESFRRATGLLKDLSFPTIAAAGPHAALPHYSPRESSNRNIESGLFLVDSGAQYEDGTTDVTRTVPVGKPTRLMQDRFTRVLKGHIAIAEAVFPAGTTGAQLDAFSRTALWQAGVDFDHGTGHGVGSYLSVHEGPQRLSKTGTAELMPGMILSNEPGYYLPSRFGVRIENLVLVEKRRLAGSEREMLGFETLTLAPIDVRLVNLSMMEPYEIEWLNQYHQRVRQALSPLLDRATRRWLSKATRRLMET